MKCFFVALAVLLVFVAGLAVGLHLHTCTADVLDTDELLYAAGGGGCVAPPTYIQTRGALNMAIAPKPKTKQNTFTISVRQQGRGGETHETEVVADNMTEVTRAISNDALQGAVFTKKAKRPRAKKAEKK